MRISPKRHELEFGEGLVWTPPDLAESFYVWDKTASGESLAPRWIQVAGFDLLTDTPIVIEGQASTFTIDAGGVTASWETVAGAFDGHDPELAMITAGDAQGRAMSIDRYSVPNPESSAAATIAAQERAYLQSLLTTRANVAASGGFAKQEDPSGTSTELMEIAVLDRRVAETRARIAWFEQAAAGNSLPRAEFW